MIYLIRFLVYTLILIVIFTQKYTTFFGIVEHQHHWQYIDEFGFDNSYHFELSDFWLKVHKVYLVKESHYTLDIPSIPLAYWMFVLIRTIKNSNTDMIENLLKFIIQLNSERTTDKSGLKNRVESIMWAVRKSGHFCIIHFRIFKCH